MAAFELAAPAQILFGPGRAREAGPLAAGLGRKALLVAGTRGAGLVGLETWLREAGVAVEPLSVSGEPDVALVQAGVQQARLAGCDLVVAIGGGSAIDAAKAIAALLTNPGEPFDYLEVVGRGQPLTVQAAPVIAIPTTAGTGSEVTRNAVLSVPEQHIKVSLRSPLMLPRAALVDPELTYSLPPALTAATGMDALAQVIEPYVSARANPMADLFCREGIARAGRGLLRAYRNGGDREAREDMSFASLMGGLALANAGLGAVHGFAGPVGGTFGAPHGAVCAALLPPVVQVNARALAERAPQHPALARYAEIARWLTGFPRAAPEDLAGWLADLRRQMEIPGLRAYGLDERSVEGLAQVSAGTSSMKANPIALTGDELREILTLAL